MVVPSSSSSSSLFSRPVGVAQQHRHGLNLLRRNGSPPTATTGKKSLTTAIVGGTVGVVFVVYFVCVVAVTLIGWQHVLGNKNHNSFQQQQQHDSYEPISQATIQQRWNALKQERGLKDIAPLSTTHQTKRRDIFKQHQIDAPLNVGVKPEVLLHHDPTHTVTAMTEDIPLAEHPTPDHILTAYLEPLNFDEWDIRPLPIRKTATATQLQKITYSRLNSCRKLTQQWPVDDSPVDVDSFLPWIHDVFPTADGKFIQIIAQNKRRCKNGSQEKHILAHQQPQAALFQHVSVQNVTTTTTTSSDTGETTTSQTTRYRLCPHDVADVISTRFICRYKIDGSETFSTFNFDYDWTAHRKRYKFSFREDDAGIKAIHTSQLTFRCPVPAHLVDRIRTGETVYNDYATLFFDLIPIRTPPRFGVPNQYFPPMYKSEETKIPSERFDPVQAWGDQHILPRIEDSGRWENIPICKPSLMTYGNGNNSHLTVAPEPKDAVPPVQKRHRLVSCIWASAGYTTRGNRFAINDGQRRLLEWITYNKIIGFDHVYLYDNSGAFTDDISLKAIADLFPNDVTYIAWPAQICNNNPNNVDSVGERSSQYAAEASCRLRFGPHVDWIGQFDIDEYLIPMGRYKTATALLDTLDKEGTKIISFASWRAWPRWAYIDEPVPINDPTVCWHNEPCFELSIQAQHSLLQAYNCDRAKPGQKTATMPAEKQLYRADYVLSHFVHYSVATVTSELNETEFTKQGFKWKGRAFPDPRQRFGDEVNEALMIHTKAVATQDTAGWERMCHINNTYLPIRRQGLCRLGVPYPDDWSSSDGVNSTPEGWAYNCYVNNQVEQYLAPRLHQALLPHANFFRNNTNNRRDDRNNNNNNNPVAQD